MQITDKQRKFLWIAAGILAVVYLGPSLVNAVRMSIARAMAPAYAPKPSPAHLAPQTVTVNANSRPSTGIDPKLLKLIGNYTGGAVLADRGFCRLSVQIKPNADLPGEFTGYSTMSCGPNFLARGRAAGQAATNLAALTPISTSMTGTPAGSAIAFTVDKNFGIPIDGCPISSMTVTPFAGSQIAAEWKAGSCHGGQLILNRK